MARRRRIVSAFGSCASGAETTRVAILGPNGNVAAMSEPPATSRLRERAQPRLPARSPREGRGRRLLDLARVHAGRGPGSDPGAGPRGAMRRRTARCVRRATRPSASSTTSGRPRPRRPSGPPGKPASSSSSSSRRTAAAGSSASGRPLPPTTCGRSRRCRARAPASGSPPTPCVRARAHGSTRSAPTPPATGLVLHVHADEQPREIEECLAEHGLRPIELLAATGCLGPRTTVVHATHANERELDLVAEHGAGVCLCPTTEANLGDGFPPLEGLLARRIPLCIGSDSNVRDRPARGAARARGNGPPADASPQRDPGRGAPGDRLLVRRERARARRVARRRGRPRPPALRGVEAADVAGRARARLRRRCPGSRPSPARALSSAASPPGWR